MAQIKRNSKNRNEIPEVEQKTEGKTVGIDIGEKTVISCSSGFQSKPDKHGWTLDKILEKISGKRKGSKGFEKCRKHRDNHIGWCVNKLRLRGVKTLKREGIKYLRWGSKCSRKLAHWTYTTIFDKLEDACLCSGVQSETVCSTYTSQRCSQCGWTRKRNRKGQRFKCDKCLFECDADLNASFNISLDLPAIRKEERLRRFNRAGFYWLAEGQELSTGVFGI